MYNLSLLEKKELQALIDVIQVQGERLQKIEAMLLEKFMTPAEMMELNPHFKRNFLPNDDSAVQKNLIATWQLRQNYMLSHEELMASGFRVFSQNEEDGILLRLFTQIGCTNRFVVEIGSNCNGSDVGIPENLSTNLIINHGWHGAIFEKDSVECERMRYFFARDHATRHFHWDNDGVDGYFSPIIIQKEVNPLNVNDILTGVSKESEPDLMVVDIDGGDFSLIKNLNSVNPRVFVVEFERRFRDRYSVIQMNREDYSKHWKQSGAASLLAWVELMRSKGYILCAITASGFNAFFVRSDVAGGKILPLTATQAFDKNPIFSQVNDEYWLKPDETWKEIESKVS